jgi:hypothetical protein
MTTARPRDPYAATPYDLIELLVDCERHQAGDRGTVIEKGVEAVLVDFNWRNGRAFAPETQDAVRVASSMFRVVERRHPGRTWTGWE